MISFLLSFIALIIGYLIYGRVVERVFAPDDRVTPAVANSDGVDNVAMPWWRVFMIQFLNIAGTGPIFGAIMGAWFGPAAYLWIVLGSIFAGGVHDYMCGMMSMRNDGAGVPTMVGRYLGNVMHKVMLLFCFVLLMLVGVVFVYSPALILHGFGGSTVMWIAIIFGYYMLATLLPVDKVIGKIYPVFAMSLIFMALGLMVVLLFKWPALPELWNMGDLTTWTTTQVTDDGTDMLGIVSYVRANPLFPCLFITIACGAISGFHATQSPIMSRCLQDERYGRQVFYGAMIVEGIVALIWATVAMWFFYYGGWREVVGAAGVDAFLAQVGTPGGKTLIQYFTAPAVVNTVCTGWLGIVGGILAVLGVVAAPITSGDTAFRSARVIIAEEVKLPQRPIRNRLIIAIPIFVVAVCLLLWQIDNPDGFNSLWQYFGWSNQTLATIALWTATAYLYKRGSRGWWITAVPAVFMTIVVVTFGFVSPLAFG